MSTTRGTPTAVDLASGLRKIKELADRPELCGRIADDVVRLRDSHRFMRWLESHADADAALRDVAQTIRAAVLALDRRIVHFQTAHATLDPFPHLSQINDLLFCVSSEASLLLAEVKPRPTHRRTDYEGWAVADRIATELAAADLPVERSAKGLYGLILWELFGHEHGNTRRFREAFACKPKASKRRTRKR
jgi:hypothetical protein